MAPWSFSGIKAFKTCARRYYETKVAKTIQEPDNTEALLYGKAFHEAAETYAKGGDALPEQFSYAKRHLDTLLSIEGERFCEYKMALTDKLEPCDFFDPQAWCRGVADLLIVNNEKGVARCIDYKTGRSTKYADTSQLELMSLMLFKHFPKVRKVKAGLLFVVANEFKPAEYTIEQEHTYWRTWMHDVGRLKIAHSTGVWNPNPGGLCRKHCPVITCDHNGANK